MLDLYLVNTAFSRQKTFTKKHELPLLKVPKQERVVILCISANYNPLNFMELTGFEPATLRLPA